MSGLITLRISGRWSAPPLMRSVGREGAERVQVLNVHERELGADCDASGALIDSLAPRQDRLWPNDAWPRMKFDAPLGVGAKGGHGPIRYFVEEYTPKRSIRFRFTGPKGFDGYHGYEVVSVPDQPHILRQTLSMNTHGLAILSWPLVYRPLHDALIEDSLSRAQASLGLTPEIEAWSLWVRILRWVVSGGKARRS